MLVVLLLGACQAAFAQGGGGVDFTGTGGRHVIHGRIYFPSGLRADTRLKVRLESTRYGNLQVLADIDGAFSFRALLPGTYIVIIEGGDVYETHRESVFIDGEVSRPRSGLSLPTTARNYQVQAHLQLKRTLVAKPKPGVIDASLANIPEPARKAYEKALEFSHNGENLKAIDHLKQAIAFHSSFPVALNELGVQYLKVGQVDAAAGALSTAVKLAPQEFHPNLNYGIALLNQKKFPEAEQQLRTAVNMNQKASTAHMYLGMALIQLRRLAEAQSELEIAVNSKNGEIALAHRYLGGIYWGNREYKRAADQLDTYIKLAPNAPDAEKIKQSIKDLRKKG
jgi:Tfp pilus assembly protein PilF